MSVNKIVSIISIVLISSQLLVAPLSFAGEDSSSVAVANTPEVALLENMIALQGENLSQPELQTETQKIGAAYLASAPVQGQAERMEQALVQLGVYTPEQARFFMADAEQTATRASELQPGTSEYTNLISTETTRLAQTRSTGAQFSFCGVASIVGGASFITGLVLLSGQDDGTPRANAGEAIALMSFFFMLGLAGTC